MRVLVLCDDYWHPARTVREGLAPLEGAEFAFDWIEDAREWSAEHMAEYPVAVLSKSNNVSAVDRDAWMTSDVEARFREYVRGGGGLVVIHSGSAEYKEARVLRALIGGVFASHPPQCKVVITPERGHPLTRGVTAFTVFDEHYFMDLDDPKADVFLRTQSEYGEQPGGWTRSEGEGRVCLLTPGHNLDVWLQPDYQALIYNALCWCGKVENA